jgi:hypothetical protein
VPAIVHLDTSQDADGRWQASLTIDLHEGHQERRLSGASCAALVSGAAVIVASAIEGTVSEVAKPSGTSPPVPPAKSFGLTGTVSALADRGTLPVWPAGGASVAIGWKYPTSGRRFRAMIEGGFFPARTSAPNANGISGRFSLLEGTVRGCMTVDPFIRLEVGGCLGFGLAWMRGAAVGPPESVKGHASWGSWGIMGIGPLVTWNINNHVALFGRVDATLAVAQDTFLLKPNDTFVYRPDRTVLRGALGVEVLFP